MEIVKQMQTRTGYVTTWMIVSELTILVECVTDRELYTNVDVRISLRETAIVTVTY